MRVFRLHQICTKGVPENMNPFASLIITYLVGAAVAFIMFLILGDSRDILTELKKANWTFFVLGIVPLYITKRSEAVLQWGEKKKYQKNDD